MLRMNRKAADNRKINANFKKGGGIGYQTVVLLMKCVHDKKNATEESGKNLYLFVAFFLTNSIASYPPFLKLRLSLMRGLRLYCACSSRHMAGYSMLALSSLQTTESRSPACQSVLQADLHVRTSRATLTATVLWR